MESNSFDDIDEWLQKTLGSCTKEKLNGGNLNFVWRVFEASGSTKILKYAPPYIASKPEIALDSKRIDFEANSLSLLQGFASDDARSPKLFNYDSKLSVIIMEDAGKIDDLNTFVTKGGACEDVGSCIGRFIANLHSSTYGKKELLHKFNNIGIQNARLQILYRSVSTFLKEIKEPQAEALGSKAAILGEKLATEDAGICLTMGDLWPPSILIKKGQIRIVDWEFAHYGNPIQDVAHLVSHLWMLEHTLEAPIVKENAQRIRKEFLLSYKNEITKNGLDFFSKEFIEDCNIHFGCELLMRAIGTFKENYLYEKFPRDSEKVKEAVQFAVKHMLSEESLETFVVK